MLLRCHSEKSVLSAYSFGNGPAKASGLAGARDGVVDGFSPGRECALSSIKFFGIMRFDRVFAGLSTSDGRLFEDDEGDLPLLYQSSRDQGRTGSFPTGDPVPVSVEGIA